MDYSPKLKKAAAEIEAIMKKYDIAGVCIIHTPGFGEFINHLTPSYSALKVKKDTGELQISTKNRISNKLKGKAVADTANMMTIFINVMSHLSLDFNLVIETISEKFKIINREPKSTSQKASDN